MVGGLGHARQDSRLRGRVDGERHGSHRLLQRHAVSDETVGHLKALDGCRRLRRHCPALIERGRGAEQVQNALQLDERRLVVVGLWEIGAFRSDVRVKESLKERDDLVQARAHNRRAKRAVRSGRPDGRRLDGQALADVLLRAGKRREGGLQSRFQRRVDDARRRKAVRGLEHRDCRRRRGTGFAVRGEFRDAQCGEGVLHVADRIDAEVGRSAWRDDRGLESKRSVWRGRRRGEGGSRSVIRRQRCGGNARFRSRIGDRDHRLDGGAGRAHVA